MIILSSAVVAQEELVNDAQASLADGEEELSLTKTEDLGTEVELGSGVIEGIVFEGQSGRGIVGVIVEVLDLGLSARTDSTGAYTIKGVSADTYTLSFIKSGYLFEEREVTILNTKSPFKLEVGLETKPEESEMDAYLLDVYEVVEDYVDPSEGSALDLDLDSTRDGGGLITGMGQADFSRQGVSDAGGAISKVSGANIVDGKYAVVRGLADRYISTTYNGAVISSADPVRKAVQLDLFPTSGLEAITVDKTYYHALPGDFGGGAIDLVPRKFPEERILTYKHTITQSSLSSGQTILTHPDRDLGLLGIDADEYAIPNDLLYYVDADGVTQWAGDAGSPYTAAEFTERSQSLLDHVVLQPDREDGGLWHSHSFTYGDVFTFDEEKHKIGYLMNFKQSQRESAYADYVYNNISLQAAADIADVRQSDVYTSTQEVDWSAFGAFSYSYDDRHTLSASMFRKRNYADNITHLTNLQDRQADGSEYGGPVQANYLDTYTDSTSGTYYGEIYEVDTVIREYDVQQINGQHELWEGGPTISWQQTNSQAAELHPSTSQFEYTKIVLDGNADQLALLDEYDTALTTGMYGGGTIGRDYVQEIDDLLASWTDASPDTDWRGTRDTLFAFLLDPAYTGIDYTDAIARAEAYILEVDVPSVGFGEGEAALETWLNNVLIEGEEIYTLVLAQIAGFSLGLPVSEFERLEVREETSDSYWNVDYPLFQSADEDVKLVVNAGWQESKTERETRARRYDLRHVGDTTTSDYFYELVDGAFSRGELGLENYNYLREAIATGNSVVEPGGVNNVLNLDGGRIIEAMYTGAEFKMDNKTLKGGVRWEKETRDFEIIQDLPNLNVAAGTESGSKETTTWLPYLNLSGSLYDDTVDFLFAWSRTVARPSLYEFIPSRRLDSLYGVETVGQFDLIDSKVNNYDVSLGGDVNDLLSVRVSGFYKHIENPIFTSGNAIRTQPANGDLGEIYGVELEGQLDGSGPWVLKTNYTYIDGQMTYRNPSDTTNTEIKSSFPGQASHIFNTNLGYVNDDRGVSANLIYNFVGRYNTVLPLFSTQDPVVNEPFHSLDFVANKTFEYKDMTLTLGTGVRNLLDREQEISVGGLTATTNQKGREYSISAEMSF